METTKFNELIKPTFEDIQKANETIVPTAISRTDSKTGKEISKDYAEVNQRVKAFRMVYPDGFINTQMVSNENGVCIFRASIGDGQGNLLATGTAYEKENSTFINKTSYIENCETSAVGRALGMAGFGIDTSIASAEEVQNAIANQKEEPKKEVKATDAQIKLIASRLNVEQQKQVIDTYKLKNITELTIKQASAVIKCLPKENENE